MHLAITFQQRAFIQMRHEQFGCFGTQYQSAPQLIAGQCVDQRIERIVDLNQVLKLHDGDMKK